MHIYSLWLWNKDRYPVISSMYSLNMFSNNKNVVQVDRWHKLLDLAGIRKSVSLPTQGLSGHLGIHSETLCHKNSTVYINNRILFSYKNEIMAFAKKMDGTGYYYLK